MIDNQTLSSIAISAAAVVLAKIVYDRIQDYNDPLSKIPGPPNYPIIGNPGLLRALFRSKRHEYVAQMVEKYGDILRMDFIGPTVFVVNAQEAKRILNSSTFVKSDTVIMKIGIGILNNALFAMPSNDHWKKHRKLLQPAFGPTHLRHAGKVAEDTMKDLDTVIEEKLQGKSGVTLDFTVAFKSVTLDVISMVGFNHSFGSTKKLQEDIEWQWQELENLVSVPIRWRVITPRFLWSLFGVSLHSNFIQTNKKAVFSFLDKLADERIQKINDKTIVQESWDMDILHRLLKQENGFTKEEIYGELLGFFFAGHETTSATMGWALYKICDHPEVEAKLYDEIKSVNLDDPSLVDQLYNYKYLEKFIKEVQRTYSIVNAVQRVAVEDTEIMGYKIPKGTKISVGIASIQMSEKYYKEPHKFNPDRWDEPHVPGAFIPFGDGQHNCIGQKMALIEAKVFLIHLLQKYKFKLAAGFVANGITKPTLRLETLPVIVSKRVQ
ncbi:hypothetical protein HDV01_001110 [Terramyces sp. JEL0728]|nr:hypothetical protein HDV01_001110 [Terramyces sp. JEL0728]